MIGVSFYPEREIDFLVLLLFPSSGRLIRGGFREVELWGREELLSRAGG